MNTISWDQLSPVVSYANALQCEPGFVFGPRIIFEHQFIFVVEGTGAAHIGGEHFRACPGDLFYYGPKVVHRFQASNDDPFAVYGILFSLRASLPGNAVIRSPEVQQVSDQRRYNSSNDTTIGDPGPHQLKLPSYFHFHSPWVFEHLLEIVKQFEEEDYISLVHCRILLSQFLVKLHRALHDPTANLSKSSLLEHVRSQLVIHASDQYDHAWLHDWTHFHSDHVARLFRRQYNVSPHEYHVDAKISLARKLLAGTSMTVTEIAEHLHVGTVHYFSRLFKNKTGYVPTEYRKLRQMI